MTNIETIVTSVLGAIGGAALVVGGLAAWLGSVWKGRIERQESMLMQIDVDLRTRRTKVYEELWTLTAVVPRWPRNDTLTYENLKEFSEALQHWYFHIGGMYLSSSSRDGYTLLQDELARLSKSGRKGVLAIKPTDDYEAIRDRCSQLRTLLSADIESRRESSSKS